MEILTQALDDRYAYCCSKASVKKAFGDGLLDRASFGLTPAFEYDSRHAPKPKIKGNVVMSLTVRSTETVEYSGRTSLYVFRSCKEDLDDRVRTAVADVLNGQMRQWLESKLGRPATEVFGTDELLVELYDGQLLLHETRFR
jgi:hypothetical protein